MIYLNVLFVFFKQFLLIILNKKSQLFYFMLFINLVLYFFNFFKLNLNILNVFFSIYLGDFFFNLKKKYNLNNFFIFFKFHYYLSEIEIFLFSYNLYTYIYIYISILNRFFFFLIFNVFK